MSEMFVQTPKPEFYTAGGTLKFADPSYIARKADAQLWNAIKQHRYCYLLTSRQMGKSSLMVHTATRIRDNGMAAAIVDLTSIGRSDLTSYNWYLGQNQDIPKTLG